MKTKVKNFVSLVTVMIFLCFSMLFVACIDEHSHYYKGTVEPPTCTEEGYTLYQCSCGDSYKEKIAALGHTYGELVTAKPATLTENGYNAYYHCEVCGTYFDENKVVTTWADLVIGALGHTYGDLVTAKPATCLGDGYKAYYYCEDCETYFDENKVATTWADLVIGALGHNSDGKVDHKDADCTNDGVVGGTYCTRCNDGKSAAEATIDALGHDNKGSIDHKDADCTKEGVVGGTYCTRCNDGKADAEAAIDALGHDNKGSIDHKDADCTNDGVVGGTYCTRCNDGKADAEAAIDALGHDNKGSIDHKDADCTNDGVVGGTYCTRCNDGKSAAEATIPAKGHSFTQEKAEDKYLKSVATETSPAIYYKSCVNCGKSSQGEAGEATFESGSAIVHKYTAETVEDKYLKSAATCASPAIYYKSCADCGKSSQGEVGEATFESGNVIGHDYGDLITAIPVTCTSDGRNAYYHCKECDGYFDENKVATTWDKIAIISNGHAYGDLVHNPATCTQNGYDDYYYCDVCKTYFDAEKVQTTLYDLEQDATEHINNEYFEAKDVTCAEDGNLEYLYCSDCKNYLDIDGNVLTWNDIIVKSNGHNYGDLQVSVAVSCTADGNHAYYYCDRCDTYFDSYKNTTVWEAVQIKSSGHNYGDLISTHVTCTTDGYQDYYHCDKCNGNFDSSKNAINLADIIIKSTGHDYGTLTAAQAVSGCTVDGWNAYYQCSKCSKYFNEQFEEKAEEDIILKASHSFGEMRDFKVAKCTEDGNQWYYKCSKCSKYFDYYKRETTWEALVLPAHGHKIGGSVEEQAATCVTSGMKLRYECIYCDLFFDENKENPQPISNYVIPALGHTYSNLIPAKAATNTSAGNIAYYKCSKCNSYFDSSKNVTSWNDILIGVIGHTYSDLIPATDPTCTQKGLSAHYTCKDEGCTLYFNANKEIVSLSQIEIQPTGHIYNDLGSLAPTCTSRGYKQHYICDECCAFFDENKVEKSLGELQIPTIAHTYSDLCSLAPTCTQSGYKPYYRCTTCDGWFNSSKEKVNEGAVKLNELGHDYDTLVSATATCTKAGVASHYYCTQCKTYFDAEKVATTLDALQVSAFNHKNRDYFEAKDVTCTKDGHRAYSICRDCGTYFDANGNVTSLASLIIKTLGHNYVDNLVSPTCVNQGYTQHRCSTCGYICQDTLVAAIGHNYVNDLCVNCNEPLFALIFTLSEGSTYYIVSGMQGSATTIVIPSEYLGTPVKEIAASAFEGDTALISVTIPTSITTIGEKAFKDCINLDVTIEGTIEADFYEGMYYNADSELTSIGNYAFSNTAITTVAFPKKLKIISEGVFDNCTKLETCFFHSQLTAIRAYAFRNTGIKKMFTSSQMDTIGKSAFEGCSQLTHISLKGITSINERTFAGTAIAGELTIPSAIQYIKDEAFMDCKNITKVTVTYNSKETRNNLRDIRTKAFFGCTSLTEVDVKRLTVTVGYAAFGGCPSLKVVKIPFVGVQSMVNKNGAAGTFGYIFGGADVIDITKRDGLTTVKQFYDEQKTTEVVYYIPSSIKRVVLYGGTGASVWSGMFSNCTMIESIDVQSGNIRPNAFYGCSNLKTLNVQYSGKYDSTKIKIYPHAFDGLYYLKELYISGLMKDAFGSSVMAIDDLLKDCTSLEKLEIPIGGAQEFYKFFDSSASNGFVVPQSLKSVTVRDSDDGGLISFQNCIHITDITIGEGITRVQALRYFMGCTSLKNLVISNSVTIIKRGALYGCSALENLTIPFVGSNTEADIANDNYYCEFFGEIFGVNEYEGSYRVSQPPEIDRPVDYFIPQTLTTVTVTGGEIYYHAFYGYESITSIGLSNVKLYNYAFSNMHNLENLYLYGDNIKTDSKQAFTDSSKPNKIHVDSLENWFLLPRTLTYFIRNGHLYVGEELLRGEVVIPGTVTSIYKDQFRNMVDITSIVFENGIVSIDEWAFYGCANITSITLPETLETIGENAFAKCTSLVSVTCPAIIVERGLLPATVKYLTITSGEVKNLNNLPELVSLTLEDGVTVIGADVCTSNCDNLKTLTIGKGLTTWTQGAFSSCTKLETITVSADNPNFKSENNVLYSKDGKTEYLSAQEQPTI